jgi:predicted RNA-binding protein YlxR (DUF448 family)
VVQRHVPGRTCVACRESKPKRALVRVVRRGDGSVAVDPTGKQPGRGAYLCHDPACWRAGLRKGTLTRALKTVVAAVDREALERFAASLSGAEPGPRAGLPAERSE